MDEKKWNFGILLFFLIVLLGFEVYSIVIKSTYVWDGLALVGLLFLCYSLKDLFNLHPLHFFLFGIFLVLHNLGVFGFYEMAQEGIKIERLYFGIEYDTYVHLFFGLVCVLILGRAYDNLIPIKDNRLKFSMLLTLVLGLSALHEILEYLGGSLLGPGAGFLRAGTADLSIWDTQTDMRNNLFGGLIAMLIIWFKSKEVSIAKKKKKKVIFKSKAKIRIKK